MSNVVDNSMYRVVITRKKTKYNPNYKYWEVDKEPRYFILDDEFEQSISKPISTKGSAKGMRTRLTSYSPDTLVSAVVQKAEMVWQTLTEDEL